MPDLKIKDVKEKSLKLSMEPSPTLELDATLEDATGLPIETHLTIALHGTDLAKVLRPLGELLKERGIVG